MMTELSFSVTRPFNKVCCQVEKMVLIFSAITTHTLIDWPVWPKLLGKQRHHGRSENQSAPPPFLFPLCILKMMLIIPHSVRLYELPLKQIAESHFAMLSEQCMLML